jgi:hypothetical protein
MNRVFLSLCLLAVVAAVVPVPPAHADQASVNGVIAEERIVRLPNDQGKWYVSVVGDASDAAYQRVLGWFDTNASLKTLRAQVHFCPVTADTAVYVERYASNVKGLPTVRVQKPVGEVVYEASGKNLPLSAEGLYGAIADGVYVAQGIRPVLPWRRDMERRCQPGPQPEPSPQPQPDPEPSPIDDGGAPAVEPQTVAPGWVLPLLCVVGFVGGLVAGYGRQVYAKLRPVK